MNSSILTLILIGIIGAVSLFGGYRLAKAPSNNTKRLRFILSVIVAVILVAWLLYDMGFLGDDTGDIAPSQPIPTQIPVKTETLNLNETTTYTLIEGDAMALTYTGELGQVVTLTLKPDSGNSPTVAIIKGNPPTRERSIQARGLQTIICGYQFSANGQVTFSFQAAETTTYTVELVDGNACRG